MNTEKELLEYLRGKQIYIYGIGEIAEALTRRLKRKQIPLQGYLVANKETNSEQIDDVKVYELEEFLGTEASLENLTIVITVSKEEEDILGTLMESGFQNIILLSNNACEELIESQRLDECSEQQEEYLFTTNYPAVEPRHCVVIEKKTGRMVFRCEMRSVMNDVSTTVKQCKLSHFEELYGRYCKLPFTEHKGIDNEFAKRIQLEIYAATSPFDKNASVGIAEEGVIPLQVGAALAPFRKRGLTDDTGENISVENRNYCECTGLYWVWKNTKGQKYVGLCHYRRRFRWDRTGVNYMLQNGLDAVVTVPKFDPHSMMDYFLKFIGRSDWELLRSAVKHFDAAYEEIFRQYEKGNFVITCNLAIFKREWFERYCEFAFTVAAEIDSEYKKKNIVRQDRYMGYLFENMLSLFLIRHKEEMKIAYADMEFLR